MKTEDGWVRGKMCGKKPAQGFAVTFVCVLCGRPGTAEELCFPVPRSSFSPR